LKVKEDGEFIQLAKPVWNWNLYYEKMVKMVLNGSWDYNRRMNNNALNCWWGMDSGVIDVNFSDSLKWVARKNIRVWKTSLINNYWNPFEGELRSQNGIVQEDSHKRLDSEDIIDMNWLNYNIVGEIPQLDELNADMYKMAYMSGIKGLE